MDGGGPLYTLHQSHRNRLHSGEFRLLLFKSLSISPCILVIRSDFLNMASSDRYMKLRLHPAEIWSDARAVSNRSLPSINEVLSSDHHPSRKSIFSCSRRPKGGKRGVTVFQGLEPVGLTPFGVRPGKPIFASRLPIHPSICSSAFCGNLIASATDWFRERPARGPRAIPFLPAVAVAQSPKKNP